MACSALKRLFQYSCSVIELPTRRSVVLMCVCPFARVKGGWMGAIQDRRKPRHRAGPTLLSTE